MSNRRYKVLVLASTFPRWVGDHQPSFVLELCRRLAVERDVTVLAPGAPGAAADESIDGVRVRRYTYAPRALQSLAYGGGLLANLREKPWRAFLVPGLLAAQWRSFDRLVRSESWDVVHAHWTIPQGIAAASAMSFLRCPRPRLVVTAHGSDLLRLRGSPWDSLNRYALTAADAVTVVGPELENRALGLGVPSDRLHWLPMGIDVETRFVAGSTSEANKARILFVGRLVPEKGADLAIRALQSVVKCHPDAQMEIIGVGPQRVSLEVLVERLGLAGRVRFAGGLPPDQLPSRYRAASVCVVPSRSEGFGLVALEAMACARPVILADLPSLRRISMDGDAADLVPPDDAKALAAAITRLLGDRPRRDRIGARGRKRAESYSWLEAAMGYAKLIDRLATEAPWGPHGKAARS